MTTITDVVNDLINLGTVGVSSKNVFHASATETISGGTTTWAAAETTSSYTGPPFNTDTATRFLVDTGVPNDVEIETFSKKSGLWSTPTEVQVLAYDSTNALLGLPNGTGGFAQYYLVSDSPVLNTGTITDLGSTGSYTAPAAACYVEGTRIRTAHGDVAIETLTEGDAVAVHTRQGVVMQPVVWVGRRRVDIAANPDPDSVLPIRIRRDAFAPGLPSRDLLISPDHAIYLDGMLIPAKLLVNGGSIVQESGWTSVVYYHVELPEHGIIYADGLPAETYLDTGNRGLFENGGVLMMLHPDFSISARLQRREDGACAPFVVAPGMVRPIWHGLAQRSGRIGYPVSEPETITTPDLRLLTPTRSLRPLSASNDSYVFVLPADVQEVRLVSRAARPNETRPWVDDVRRLGVRVGRITVRDGNELTEISLDGPALAQGWWAVEFEGNTMARWTDGDARLALPHGQGGGRILELKLCGSTPYPVEHAQKDVLPARKAA